MALATLALSGTEFKFSSHGFSKLFGSRVSSNRHPRYYETASPPPRRRPKRNHRFDRWGNEWVLVLVVCVCGVWWGPPLTGRQASISFPQGESASLLVLGRI